MSRSLMTHSLLNSWLYAIKENPYETADGEKPSAMAEFMQTLNREYTPPNEAMQKGIDFEDLVTAIIDGTADTEHKWYPAANEVAKVVSGGVLQYRARKEITVCGMDILLYGRLDVLKAGVIYDIKFSGSYEVGKYHDGTQHPTYFEVVPQANDFTYLVSNGSNVWPESYTRENTPSITPTIEQFFNWLNLNRLMEVYKDKWLAL